MVLTRARMARVSKKRCLTMDHGKLRHYPGFIIVDLCLFTKYIYIFSMFSSAMRT
jgi:hypothetical protein